MFQPLDIMPTSNRHHNNNNNEGEPGDRNRNLIFQQSGIMPTSNRHHNNNNNDGRAAQQQIPLFNDAAGVGYWSNSNLNASQPDSSSRAAASRQTGKKTSKCVACGDAFYASDVVTCEGYEMEPGCGHEYCGDCISALFRAAMTDETLYPPQCCKVRIPIESCLRFLSDQLLAQFAAKRTELDTPASERAYCHLPTCSTFIPPTAIRDAVALCLRCSALTCTTCKKAAHLLSDCPDDDPAVQSLLALAHAEGWKRCYSCSRLVELTIGCNHMSEFLFPCGQWISGLN